MSFYLEEPLINLYGVCLANSSCSSFHYVDLWSYGGAWKCLAFLLPVWITFRDGNLSLNFALSKFGPSMLRLAFQTGTSDWTWECSSSVSWTASLAENFPWLTNGCCDSHYSLLQPILFSFSDYCAFPFPFRGELADRFFVCGWPNVQSFPIPTFIFLEILATRGMPRITFSILTTNSSFAIDTRTAICRSWWASSVFRVSCLSAELSLFTALPGRFPLPCPFFAVTCLKEYIPPSEHEPFDVQDRHSSPFCPIPSKEQAAGARSFERSFLRDQHVLLLPNNVIHHGPQSLVAYRFFSKKTMSWWWSRVHHECGFFTCRSYKLPNTCSSKSLPWANNVSSQIWLNILKLSLHNSTLNKLLKFIVCTWVLLIV